MPNSDQSSARQVADGTFKSKTVRMQILCGRSISGAAARPSRHEENGPDGTATASTRHIWQRHQHPMPTRPAPSRATLSTSTGSRIQRDLHARCRHTPRCARTRTRRRRSHSRHRGLLGAQPSARCRSDVRALVVGGPLRGRTRTAILGMFINISNVNSCSALIRSRAGPDHDDRLQRRRPDVRGDGAAA